MAGTAVTTGQLAVADQLFTAAAGIKARHALITPPWLTVAVPAEPAAQDPAGRRARSDSIDDESVALALSLGV